MSWTIRAEGGARTADRDEVRRALGILMAPMQTFELRGLPSGRSRICRATDLDTAVESAWDLSDDRGVYWTMNPCHPDLNKAASNKDILARRWFPIDCDAVRPADVSSTDEEKGAAIDLVCRTAEYLSSRGWPEAVWIDSGNGGWLFYRAELPANKESQQLFRDALAALADRLDTDKAKIDRAVHNAARIAKLPGTWARKGTDTPDRPHRMARLLSAPADPSEVVTADMLRALLPAKAQANGHANGHTNGHPWGMKASGPSLDRYIEQAIRGECNRVSLTPEGGRNTALNIAAFNLGTMAGWPEMDHANAKIALYESAKAAGLGEQEAARTIGSGWDSGASRGRSRPAMDPTGVGGIPKAGAQVGGSGPVKLTVGLNEINEEDVDWIYENIIALGFITIFAGQTSQGKSFVVCDLIARLTKGEALPFSQDQRPPSSVLMISEDPLEHMLAPRLNEMGATKDMVRFLTWEAMASYTLEDTDMLDQAYLECKQPILLIIDPPQNFLGRTDEHKNAEVRTVLMRVVAWLQKRLAACILIMHVNKQVGKGLAALDRIMGSVAWATTPRIAIGFSDDPDVPGQHIMAGVKNNLGPKAQARTYKIVPSRPKRAKIEWGTLVDITADDAMNQVKRNRTTNAATWLAELFRQQLEWPLAQFWDAAKQHGISKNAIDEAKIRLGIPKARKTMTVDGNIHWTWWVPKDWKYLGEDPL